MKDSAPPERFAPMAPSLFGSPGADKADIELGSGDGKSLGSNQLPSNAKKHELAQEQEEQKRMMRRAEQ